MPVSDTAVFYRHDKPDIFNPVLQALKGNCGRQTLGKMALWTASALPEGR
jgi:hypothetical protein